MGRRAPSRPLSNRQAFEHAGNRAAAHIGGILLALVGAYAVIVFAVDVNELTRLAA